MTQCLPLLWRYDDGRIQRRCQCRRWVSRIVKDTATNQAQITDRAQQHVNQHLQRKAA